MQYATNPKVTLAVQWSDPLGNGRTWWCFSSTCGQTAQTQWHHAPTAQRLKQTFTTSVNGKTITITSTSSTSNTSNNKTPASHPTETFTLWDAGILHLLTLCISTPGHWNAVRAHIRDLKATAQLWTVGLSKAVTINSCGPSMRYRSIVSMYKQSGYVTTYCHRRSGYLMWFDLHNPAFGIEILFVLRVLGPLPDLVLNSIRHTFNSSIVSLL